MKSLIALVIAMSISACSTTENINTSPLPGVWVTDACEQAPTEIESHEGEWGKGVYEFTQENTIKTSIQFHSDSTCTIETTLFEPDNIGESFSYIDSGATVLQEGIEGNKFSLIFSQGAPSTSIDGFYNINNDILCFSDGYTFTPFFVGVNGSGLTTNNINFEQCFVKKQP